MPARWLKSSEQHGYDKDRRGPSTPRTSAVLHDQSVRRSAQNDDSVGVLTKNTLNKLALMGLAAFGVRRVLGGNTLVMCVQKAPAIPDPRMSRITWIDRGQRKLEERNVSDGR